MSELDDLDQLAAEVFEGYLVRKDLAQQFRGQYPVPTYVGEFLLGRYCATTDPDEIAEGLAIVERSMKERTVRAGEEELFKSPRPREGPGQDHRPAPGPARRQVRRLQGRAAQPPAQRHPHLRRAGQRARPDAHRRLLRRGHPRVHRRARHRSRAASRSGSSRCGPIQMSTRDALDTFVAGRTQFTLEQWRDLLLRSVGFEPDTVHAAPAGRPARSDGPVRRHELQRRRARAPRHRQVAPVPAGLALRPPRLGRQGDDRQHVRQQPHRPARPGRAVRRRSASTRSPASRSTRRKASTSSRATWSPASSAAARRASAPTAAIVMVGNFDVDVEDELRRGHLLRADAQGDARRHRVPRPHPRLPPRLGRPQARPVLLHRATSASSATSSPSAGASSAAPRASTSPRGGCEWGSQLSGRDRKAANNTVNGLLKLLWPEPGDGGARRGARLGRRAGARAAPAGEGAAGVHRRRRVRQGRPELPGRRRAGEGRLLRRDRCSTGSGPTASRSWPQADRRQRGAARARPGRGEVIGRGARPPTTPSATSSTAASRSSRCSARAASRRSTACATTSRARSAPSSCSTTPPATTPCAARSARCARSTTRTS